MSEEDYCSRCGQYIDVDFSHYTEYDGRPIYSVSCGCVKHYIEDETHSTPKKWHAPKGCLGTLGDRLRLKLG